MKKIFLTKAALAATVFGLAVFSGAANAHVDFKFYAGAGVDYSKYKVNKDKVDSSVKVKDKGFGFLVPVLGVKVHENFGLEAGYSFNKKITIKELTQATTTFKVSNLYLDAIGFLPVAGEFDVIGGLGVGKLITKKGDNVSSVNNKIGWRAKLGAQYNFHSNIAVRALLSYQSANSKFKTNANKEFKLVKNLQSIGLSVVYTF